MIKKILILVILIFIVNSSYSQTFTKFGLKCGLIFNGISTENDQAKVVGENAFFNFLSYNFGMYGEFFNTRRFCLSSEIHFTLKGERNPNFIGVVQTQNSNQHTLYEFKYLSDRFYYLRFQLLPRFRFLLTTSNENIYVLGGPTFDYMFANSNSGDAKNIKDIENSRLEFGALFGVGIEMWDIVSFEFRVEHTFSSLYTISYSNNNITRHHNALLFLTGLNLKKAFKL